MSKYPKLAPGEKYQKYHWWIELLLLLIVVLGVWYVVDYGKDYRREQEANETRAALPNDGRVTQDDIAMLDERLNCEINTPAASFRVTHIKGDVTPMNLLKV